MRAYPERGSLRGLSRTFGVSRYTSAPVSKKALILPLLKQTRLPAEPAEDLELDELRTLVAHRRRGVFRFWLAWNARILN